MSESEPEKSFSAEELPASTAASTNPLLITSVNSNENDKGSESEGDGAEEILEESPDKRWSKRREKVKQRDVPGIDAAYLAMDNETGNEVVWNEVQFSERKNFRDQEEKLRAVFNNLTQLVHINLVKFHKYWTDISSEKPRIIFITEYMSSGSMSRFLQRARSSGTLLNIKAWKKWTTQILSALNYLHSCDPPIVHANLTCNTVFIQQNGLIKIGCVAPNAIHHHVKTFRENLKNMHYVAPEFDQLSEATTESDIYSFGICALEMATTGGLCCNGGSTESTSQVTPAMIRKAIDSLEDVKQKSFIEICLNPDPSKRPTARELLFHQALFEVHSLKLLAAHAIVNSKELDHVAEDDLRVQDATKIAISSKFKEVAYCELTTFQIDLDKFLEDVRNGIYPLVAFAPLAHMPSKLKFNSLKSVTNIGSMDSHPFLDKMEVPSSATQQNKKTSTTDIEAMVEKKQEKPKIEEKKKTPSGKLNKPVPDVVVDSPKPQDTASNTSVNVTPAKSVEPIIANSPTNTTLVTSRDEGYDTAQSGVNAAPPISAPAPLAPTPKKEEEKYAETRLIVDMNAIMEGASLKATLKLDDLMYRELRTLITDKDSAEALTDDLVNFGFICPSDYEKICKMLQDTLEDYRARGVAPETDSGKCSRKSSRQQESGSRPPVEFESGQTIFLPNETSPPRINTDHEDNHNHNRPVH